MIYIFLLLLFCISLFCSCHFPQSDACTNVHSHCDTSFSNLKLFIAINNKKTICPLSNIKKIYLRISCHLGMSNLQYIAASKLRNPLVLDKYPFWSL